MTPPAAIAKPLAFLRRHWLSLAAALALVLLGIWLGPRLLFGPKLTVEVITQRDFVQTVVASGRVETAHRVEIGVQITGTVAEVPVIEGQTVSAGALLIGLEASELRAALNQAERNVQQAQAQQRRLREVQAPGAVQALREATANRDTATQTLARTQELKARGYLAQAALDEAQRAAQVAQTQVRISQQQLDSARAGGGDAAMADATLSQAQAGADAARARLRYATVTAPLAGTLIQRHVEPGDPVQPGKVLMVLSPGGALQLVVQIDEKNLQLLRVGQPALASADAYAKRRFVAELAYINPGVDAQLGSVAVKLDVPEPPAYLMQDMTVSVDIETARRTQAVLVPMDALHDLDSAAPWVLKVTRGRAQKQAVTLGLRSNGLAEVLTGLQAGDQLVPTAAATILAGRRLRAVAPAVATTPVGAPALTGTAPTATP